MKMINDIFEKEPGGWGYRGDPHMWDELKNSFVGLTNDLSQEEFEKKLENRFNEIIEQKGEIISKEIVRFESFPQHGMSGGAISLMWWKEVGLPLIKQKYERSGKTSIN